MKHHPFVHGVVTCCWYFNLEHLPAPGSYPDPPSADLSQADIYWTLRCHSQSHKRMSIKFSIVCVTQDTPLFISALHLNVIFLRYWILPWAPFWCPSGSFTPSGLDNSRKLCCVVSLAQTQHLHLTAVLFFFFCTLWLACTSQTVFDVMSLYPTKSIICSETLKAVSELGNKDRKKACLTGSENQEQKEAVHLLHNPPPPLIPHWINVFFCF